MLRAAVLLFATIASISQVRDLALDPEAELKKADRAWSDAISSKSLDRTIESYAPDAITAGSAMFSANGLDEFREQWAALFARPGFSLSWTTERVEFTKSGTIAYTSGTWNSEGETGPFLAVWQKQRDGKWKVLIDAAWQKQ